MRASSLRRNTRLISAAICVGPGDRGWSSLAKSWRICATVNAGVFFPHPVLLPDDEPQGQQRERHVMVPTHPTAHLVVPQADFSLAGLEQLLDAVPAAMDHNDFLQGHLGRRVRERVPD